MTENALKNKISLGFTALGTRWWDDRNAWAGNLKGQYRYYQRTNVWVICSQQKDTESGPHASVLLAGVGEFLESEANRLWREGSAAHDMTSALQWIFRHIQHPYPRRCFIQNYMGECFTHTKPWWHSVFCHLFFYLWQGLLYPRLAWNSQGSCEWLRTLVSMVQTQSFIHAQHVIYWQNSTLQSSSSRASLFASILF